MTGEPTGCDDPRDVERGRRLNELFDRRLRAGGAAAATPEEVQTAAGDSSRAGSEARPAATAGAEFSGEMRECLDALAAVRAEVATLGTLVAQGVLARSVDPRYAAELGPYKIVRFIGRGGMGLVLKAYEPALDRVIALKLLRPELTVDAAALARFEREAKAAAALRHPNIVTVYAVGQEGNTRYIAMEYVAGASLAEVVRDGEARRHEGTEGRSGEGAVSYQLSAVSRPSHDCESGGSERAAPASVRAEAPRGINAAAPKSGGLSADLVRRVFREMLAGLDAAHKAGLIHRDIKAANILLDLRPSEGRRDGGTQGRSEDEEQALAAVQDCPSSLRSFAPSSLPLVKIADFGLARMRSSQTQMTVDGSVLGTPEYMSPEQARGDADIDHRTDLYSAGVVLYEMLTGRTPFKADTPTATIRRILDEEPADPRKLDKSVDPVLASLALRLMAKRPEERFGSAGEVIAALEAARPVRPPARRMRRRGRAATLLAFASLAVMSGVWLIVDRYVHPVQTAKITGVKADDDFRWILVQRGASSQWEKLCEAHVSSRIEPPEYRRDALALVDVSGDGTQAVVAGLRNDVPTKQTLVAFTDGGAPSWEWDPSVNWVWPNCENSGASWIVSSVESADLDGVPGDELVVVASDAREYPTRVSVIDPHKPPRVLATFWHMGVIQGVRIVKDFRYTQRDGTVEDRARPAIVAWGINNKLDGFYDDDAQWKDDGPPVGPLERAAKGETTPQTSWGYVSVFMILDPQRMNGLGPPQTQRMRAHAESIGNDMPYAYAFLDMASGREQGHWNFDTNHRDSAPENMVAIIPSGPVHAILMQSNQSVGVELCINRPSRSNGGWVLQLNEQLEIAPHGLLRGPEDNTADREIICGRWHPIVQRYGYVDEPVTMPGCRPTTPAANVTINSTPPPN